jgi:hypothetical protein
LPVVFVPSAAEFSVASVPNPVIFPSANDIIQLGFA